MKLQPMPLSMPSEAIPVPFLNIYTASSGIDGGIGCNFLFIVRMNIVISKKHLLRKIQT